MPPPLQKKVFGPLYEPIRMPFSTKNVSLVTHIITAGLFGQLKNISIYLVDSVKNAL